MNSTTTCFNWTPEQYASFGRRVIRAEHQYHQYPLFKDDAIISLLDNYPREWLQCFTMGYNPADFSEWKAVNIAKETTGEELFAAAQKSRFWVNITHIEEFDNSFAELVNNMYAQIGENCSHLHHVRPDYSTLLLSSPGIQVYYHLDANPNTLWHLRGKKNFWIYPAMDPRFTPQQFLEDIIAGDIDEDLPYKPEFDQFAEQYVLEPGQVVAWPQNAPHRVENIDLNMSLTTSFTSRESRRRFGVQLANKYLMRPMGVQRPSQQEFGPVPALKDASYRVINKLRPFPRKNRTAYYETDLEVDAESPNGMRQLSQRVMPAFSEAAQA